MVLTNCAVPPEVKRIVKGKPKAETPKSAWLCYLKTCAKTTPKTYLDCMKDKLHVKAEYYQKKAYWERQVLKGCPIN